MAEVHMATSSPAHSNSQGFEDPLNSEMNSEDDHSGEYHVVGEDIAVCQGSAASEAAPSIVTFAPETADNINSQSDLSAMDLIFQHLDIVVCDTGDGTVYFMDSSRVSIGDLPDEILVKILSYMSFSHLINVVQKVCSRWKRVSQDAELWANKEYHIRYRHSCNSTRRADKTDQEAIRIFCDVPNLRNVSMYRCVKSRVIRALYTHCHRLSELYLHRRQKLSYSVLKNLVEKCSRIHTLRISNKLLKSEKFSEVVSRLQYLQVLQLEEVYNEVLPVLRPLGDGCPRLAEVDFGDMTVNIDDLRLFLNAKRNTLKSIRIKWTMVGKSCVLPLLTVCADSLERLKLYEFDIVDDEAIEVFTALGSLKNLQELEMSLTELPPPGTAALIFTSGGLPKLRLLDLQLAFGLVDDTVIAICCGCPTLQKLVIRCAVFLSDDAFSEIYRLQHLEILDVSHCTGLGGALIPCLAMLPQLHTLIMEELEFPKLQPGLSSILALSSLRCLTINYSLVTGLPFDKFPDKLVSLRELNIRSCRGDPNATDGLTEQMPYLEINGSIKAEEQLLVADGYESDADLADEEYQENGWPDVVDEAQYEDSDRDSDYDDYDEDGDYDGESDNYEGSNRAPVTKKLPVNWKLSVMKTAIVIVITAVIVKLVTLLALKMI